MIKDWRKIKVFKNNNNTYTCFQTGIFQEPVGNVEIVMPSNLDFVVA